MAKGLAGKMKEGPEMEAPMEQEGLEDEENLDVEIAEGLATVLIDTPQAQEVLAQATQGGGDPAAALGVFFAQLFDKLQTKMDQSPTPLSPRIWLSNNGVLDRLVMSLEDKGLAPPGILPAVKEEVVNILKMQNQSVNAGGPPPTMQDESMGMAPPSPQQPMGPPTPQMMGGM